ncbi:hypothetical protein BSY238_573 [Methyloversatilis sp. RAC08]|uniref:hypothetical protein n=1 Tax=Methyloversatilis sp. RAC08 TaxID=1842540 RepID=UPI00083E2D1F|nr:hypothetical protein [Methyloversatilis sp. RAC08]AOF82721.1 hypothetical protein BSY238_573 [Methyloversatilis sp. RAC08]
MTTAPLSHHDILALVEPFVRRGRPVDLPASDRLRRQLVFRPVSHGADSSGNAALVEVLQLDQPAADRYRLTRTLTHASGVAARLVAEGAPPGELLARVEAIDVQRQFRKIGRFVIGLSYRLGGGDGLWRDDTTVDAPVLTDADARGAGILLTMEVSSVKGVPAELKLVEGGEGTVELPDDLLAVLGRDWDCFRRSLADQGGWRGTVRLRGRGVARSADAERKLEQTVAHLDRTLSRSPDAFHADWRAARWGVFLRRTIPVATCIGLILAAAAVPYFGISEDSVIHMLLFNSPPLLLVLFFSMREMPRIELPPRPRRLSAAAWRAPSSVQAVPTH